MTLALIAVGLVWYSSVGYCIQGLIEAMEIGADEMDIGEPLPQNARLIVAALWPVAAPVLGVMMYRADQQREGTS